jgi:AcrR family transcriptional regulator
MSGVQVRSKRRQKPRAARVGRPPGKLAGQVDERILDAARRLFLENGLAGTSIDEIARLAQAGKPTIYARFATKEALFAAVVARNAAKVRAGFGSQAPTGATIEERLANVGANVLKGFLVSDTIDFMRLSVAEARRFPQLAGAGRMARERGAQAVARVLSELAQSDEIRAFPALAPECVETTTQFFLDLVVVRFLMRALFGEDLKSLRAQIDTHVASSVAFFLAACRHSEAT